MSFKTLGMAETSGFRMRRLLMLAAALVIPISGATVVGLGGTASASGAPKVSIKCVSFGGTAITDITIYGCLGGNTGGQSQPLPATELATGGTITWVSGSTTIIGAPALTPISARSCPGYVKGAPSNPTAEKFTAAVTGGTGTNMPVNGSVSGQVCLLTSGGVTAPKFLKIKGHT